MCGVSWKHWDVLSVGHHFLVESGSAPGKGTTNGTRRSSRVKKGSENISFQSCNLDKGFGVQYGKKPYHAKTLHGGHMQRLKRKCGSAVLVLSKFH